MESFVLDSNCTNSYEYLGAHKENDGVVFRVYAPKALSVRIEGDFNSWSKDTHFLNRLETGVWEIHLKNINEYDKYKYVIETSKHELVEKIDPYGFYFELRPNWAAKFVSLDYKWHDSKWMQTRNSNFETPMNIYEVHLGGFKQKDGEFLTYEEMETALIPYVKEMGYTHIELMPLNEHSFDGSWGYQQYGYFAVTSRYGSPYQLMHFIETCHKNKIGVILDVVLAHFVKDAYGLVKYDGSHLYEPSNANKANSQWDTYYFDFEKPYVNCFLLSSGAFWFDKYHIDGLRVDAVSNLIYFHGNRELGENKKAIKFMKNMNWLLHEQFKGIMMIAEDSSDYPCVTNVTTNEGLGFDYKWDLGWMNDTLSYYNMDPEYRKYHHNKINFSMFYFYNERFLLPFSHDEVVHGKKTILDKMWGNYDDKFRQCRNLMTYMYTHPGKKLNFMGNELAPFKEFNEAEEIEWFMKKYPNHDAFKRMIRDLNLIYKNNDCLGNKEYQADRFKWIDADNNEQRIYSYIRYGDTKSMIVILNMSPCSYEEFELGVPFRGIYTEIFNSEKDIYGGCNMCNFEKIKTHKKVNHGFKQSLKIRIAPYAGIIFETRNK